MPEPVDIIAVCRSKRLAVTDNDEICPITNFLDEMGDETDDAQAACTAVVKVRDDLWMAIDLRDYDPSGVN